MRFPCGPIVFNHVETQPRAKNACAKAFPSVAKNACAKGESLDAYRASESNLPVTSGESGHEPALHLARLLAGAAGDTDNAKALQVGYSANSENLKISSWYRHGYDEWIFKYFRNTVIKIVASENGRSGTPI
jgi:hypothetical protein